MSSTQVQAGSDSIRPFRASFPQADFDDMKRRIAPTKWPDREQVNDPSQGVQLATTQALNISSGAGLVGVPGYSGYSATKFAEIGMTKSSAIEVAKRGIRINAVCPGLAAACRPLAAAVYAARA